MSLAYHICYFDLLSFDDFFEKKNTVRSLLKTQWLRNCALNFSSPKKVCQMKAGPNNKYGTYYKNFGSYPVL